MAQLSVPISKWNVIFKEYNKGCNLDNLRLRYNIKRRAIEKFIKTAKKNEYIKKRRPRDRKIWKWFIYIYKNIGNREVPCVHCTICDDILIFESAKDIIQAYIHHKKHGAS